ncbi:MAG: phage holin family protein [Ectothiorhodospiraceae bacterium]|nr:phage holin family protein [Ectothiorhodospiraceae bacterium]
MSAWLPNLIASLACLAIALRLLTFRKGRRRHSVLWAALAWALINVCVAAAILFLPPFEPRPLTWVAAVLFVLLAIRVFRCRGNVAKLWRLRT